jgi:hypothetical protein
VTASDAAGLVGLLAEDDRLRVVAALALGAASVEAVADATGLDSRRCTSALERLAAGGLVEAGEGGEGLRLAAERFKQAAQAEAVRRRAEAEAAPDAFGGAPPEAAAVLRNFVVDGRLQRIPAARGKRRVVLDWLSTGFDPGIVYPEAEVNFIIAKVHPYVAALRRYLVDEEFLERRDGFYWRAGGTFEV